MNMQFVFFLYIKVVVFYRRRNFHKKLHLKEHFFYKYNWLHIKLLHKCTKSHICKLCILLLDAIFALLVCELLPILSDSIFIGPRYTWGPIYGSRVSLTHWPCADLTDVTLADEDTNSILTDNANMAIKGNVAMQITQSGWQLWN